MFKVQRLNSDGYSRNMKDKIDEIDVPEKNSEINETDDTKKN